MPLEVSKVLRTLSNPSMNTTSRSFVGVCSDDVDALRWIQKLLYIRRAHGDLRAAIRDRCTSREERCGVVMCSSQSSELPGFTITVEQKRANGTQTTSNERERREWKESTYLITSRSFEASSSPTTYMSDQGVGFKYEPMVYCEKRS